MVALDALARCGGFALRDVLVTAARYRAVWLDMAYPHARIGIEHEGAEHVPAQRVLRDVGRYTRLVDGRRALAG